MPETPTPDSLTAAEARFAAQRIAFAPVIFQVVQVMRTSGLLRRLVQARGWMGQEQLARETGLSAYAVTVLLESALSADIVERQAAAGDPQQVQWRAGMVGRAIERDPLVRVNMDFVNDVCYRGLAHLGDALAESRPAGLNELGPFKTFYEGMTRMPEPARSSWFRFDHHYSDAAFPAALDILAARSYRHVADVGANTGKFACAFLDRFADARITLCDLPQQLALARVTLEERGLLARARLHACDLLDEASRLPGDGDTEDEAPQAFWMSQFVCCFSEEQVVGILQRAARAVEPGGSIYVLDTFWDDQQHEAAAFCLINTSPYFSALANGNSRMYRLDVFRALAAHAGLAVRNSWPGLGLCHTLVELS